MPFEKRPLHSTSPAFLKGIRDLYPFESHYFDFEGLRLHYLDEGAGDPVLLLHGNPSWSFMYRDLVGALRHECRALAPDHIGCGLSSKPGEERYSYTLVQRVADLEAFVEHLRLERRVSLVLHDWGGLIGMAWAARHPERIDRLVVLNTAGFLVPSGASLHWTIRFCRRSQLAAFFMTYFNAFSLGACRLGSAKGMSREIRQGYLGPYASARDRTAVTRFVQDIPLQRGDPAYSLVAETEDRLKQLRSRPVLICWGTRDFVFDQAFLSRWLDHFPQAEVHRFEAAGHYVLEDAATDAIPLIKEFLCGG